MARSARKLCAAQKLALLLICAALTISGIATAGDVVSYSFPAFDATTTESFVVATNSSILRPASLLFGSPSLFPESNRSEGFLLLSQTVDVWRGDPGSITDIEASFNTSFTLLADAAPVSYVVLKDSFPPLNSPGGLRGAANQTMLPGGPVPSNATGSLAFVQVDGVRSYSYGPDSSAFGLNVTVTPRGAAPAGGRAVWIEYRAAVRRLYVYVAGAGEPRPADALLVIPLGVQGPWDTEAAFVGFFAGTIRDVIVGVRDWKLTVDRFPVGDGKTKGTSWWVILLAVLGSVAAAAAIVTVVDVGLNVTVTPRGAAVRPIAVWVVYGAGEPRPSKALLDAPHH
ncbi:hypothetical protein EJB05_46963, partial [Eragrostis curvula]